MVGVGGQGILLATQITARAAIANGHDVKTNEVHGMAQRGGSVVAQIRFGEQVFSPLVPEGSAQVLASLERIEALRFAGYLSPDGLAVVSTQAIVPVTVSSGQAAYPADAEARLRPRSGGLPTSTPSGWRRSSAIPAWRTSSSWGRCPQRFRCRRRAGRRRLPSA